MRASSSFFLLFAIYSGFWPFSFSFSSLGVLVTFGSIIVLLFLILVILLFVKLMFVLYFVGSGIWYSTVHYKQFGRNKLMVYLELALNS